MRFWGLVSKPEQNDKERRVRVKVNFFGGVSVEPEEVIASDEYKESVKRAKEIQALSKTIEDSASNP